MQLLVSSRTKFEIIKNASFEFSSNDFAEFIQSGNSRRKVAKGHRGFLPKKLKYQGKPGKVLNIFFNSFAEALFLLVN